MSDTLGLLEEAKDLARDLGYRVREEPLGDLPGGRCTIDGAPHLLLNLEVSPAERLERLVSALAGDARATGVPMSRALASRLAGARDRGQSAPGTAPA